jgi:hypothetical protein
MKMSCKFKIKNNFKKVDTIIKRIPNLMAESIEDILKNIQVTAVRLEKGHKEDGIIVEMVDMSTQIVKGRVYAEPSKFATDNGQSYLWFEYFGTGQYAEQEHVGKTKHFIESGYTEWYIPVAKVGRSLNFPIVTINEQQFYLAVGSKANHFMTDAEFTTRNENEKIIEKRINEMFKEVCK